MQPPPDRNGSDHGYAAARIAASLVPVIGGGLAELMSAVFAAPVEKRREHWLRELATAISELFDKVEGLSPDRLRDNEAFISICLQASQSALRTHQREKLDALRAAVKNTVLMDTLEAARSAAFVRLVDELLPLHLQLLDMYANAEAHRENLQARNPRQPSYYPDLASVWDECHPEIPSSDPLVHLAEQELYSRRLAQIENMQVTVSAEGKLSPLGAQFLAFITDENPR